MHYRRIAVVAVLLMLAMGETRADDQVSTGDDRTGLSLAVYQGNLSLIREERRIDLPAGSTSLAVTDVPPAILPETVLAMGMPADRLHVIGQVFERGVLSPEALLAASVGKKVEVIHTNPTTGEETQTAAEVLRAQGREAVLRIGTQIRTVNVNRIAFDSLPEGLRDKPTLVLDLDGNGNGAPGHLLLRYLTGGLDWHADYVAELDEDESSLRLTGWVSLANNSGVAFRNASLRLVSGSLNRARNAPMPVTKALAMSMEARAAPPAESILSDLHVFDYDRKVSIGGNETRQLAFLPETQVTVQKEYRLEDNRAQFTRQVSGVQKDNPIIRFRIPNRPLDGLGRALPGGVMRIYAANSGGPVLLGEDRIPYAPSGQDILVTAGRALDITSERRQTDFRREGLPRGVSETAYAITLHNAKDRDVSVTVVERIPGDWTVMSESQPHEKPSAGEASWNVAIPAGGKTELTYRVRTRY